MGFPARACVPTCLCDAAFFARFATLHTLDDEDLRTSLDRIVTDRQVDRVTLLPDVGCPRRTQRIRVQAREADVARAPIDAMIGADTSVTTLRMIGRVGGRRASRG